MSRKSNAKNSQGIEPRHRTALMFDELLMQPWFLTKRVQLAITALIPPSYRQRMRDFFEDYGCMICGNDERHFANGMCASCNNKVRIKMYTSANRRLKTTLEKRVELGLLQKARYARRLLAGFKIEIASDIPVRTNPLVRVQNPVDLVLGPHHRLEVASPHCGGTKPRAPKLRLC